MNNTFKGSFWLGVGLIGMIDGILFHQILQWHSVYMYTSRFYQIVSDGLFHAFVTVITFIGAYILWKSDPHELSSNRRNFLSGLLLGGGMFNFIEGILNHHILQIHHVKPGSNQFFFDIVYDLSGLLLIGIGLYLRGWKYERRERAGV